MASFKFGAHIGAVMKNKMEYNDGSDPIVHSSHPTVTGTAVIGCTFDGGVVLGCDSVLAYGRFHRFFEKPRLVKVNDNTVLAMSGDYADFQYIQDHIKDKSIADECHNDGFTWSPESLHSWLTTVLYHHRSKINPLWNNFLVGGVENGAAFLGSADLLGVGYTNPFIATGFGRYIAVPFLDDFYKRKKNSLTEADAKEAVETCLRLLFYRQCESHAKIQMAVVKGTSETRIDPISELQSDWSLAPKLRGY